MADFTQRDAAIIERDRVLQFSQFGGRVELRFFDKAGAQVGAPVKRFWNRYRKTTRDNFTFYLFRVADSSQALAATMKRLGDEGECRIYVAGSPAERYKVTKVLRWQLGESKIWNVTTEATDQPSSTFYQQP